MASGWNLWVWLECIGVVSGCCCKEVIDFLFVLLTPAPLVLALFAAVFIISCTPLSRVTYTLMLAINALVTWWVNYIHSEEYNYVSLFLSGDIASLITVSGCRMGHHSIKIHF